MKNITNNLFTFAMYGGAWGFSTLAMALFLESRVGYADEGILLFMGTSLWAAGVAVYHTLRVPSRA